MYIYIYIYHVCVYCIHKSKPASIRTYWSYKTFRVPTFLRHLSAVFRIYSSNREVPTDPTWAGDNQAHWVGGCQVDSGLVSYISMLMYMTSMIVHEFPDGLISWPTVTICCFVCRWVLLKNPHQQRIICGSHNESCTKCTVSLIQVLAVAVLAQEKIRVFLSIMATNTPRSKGLQHCTHVYPGVPLAFTRYVFVFNLYSLSTTYENQNKWMNHQRHQKLSKITTLESKVEWILVLSREF